MISVVHNEILCAVEFHMDNKGIELLVQKLRQLQIQGDHLHIFATDDDAGVSVHSPYGEALVYGELILNLLPTEAWEDERASRAPSKP